MLIRFTFLLFSLLFAFNVVSAQCNKSSSSINVDSIFNDWSSFKLLNDSGKIDLSISLDTIINFGGSTNTTGKIHLRFGTTNDGMDFSINGLDSLGEGFFKGFFSNDNPFGIDMNMDNIFRQLDDLFEDFKGIEVIPQPDNKTKGKTQTYKI